MAFGRRETVILLAGDLFILIASLWAALFLRNLAVPAPSYFAANVIPFVPAFAVSLVVFYIAGLYEKQTRPIRSVMGIRILGAQAATVLIAAVFFFAVPLPITPKTILVLYLAVSVVAVSLWRFYRMQREVRSEAREPAILYGGSAAALELYDEVKGNDRYLIRFTAREEAAGPERVEIRARSGTTVIDLASMYEEIFDRVPLDSVSAEHFLTPLYRRRHVYDASKRVFDLVLALALSIVAIPLIFIAALALWVESGPPFIRAARVGKNGGTIRLLKLRTMLFDDKGDPELRKKNRVTRAGRLLRKSRIDELPQLWNVLLGDLSFIGPRPELPSLAAVYEQEIPCYRLRHLIPPGLSGWAQIHDYDAPRGPADVARTRRKLSYDLYYLKRRSFGLDLAIAVKTLRALLAFSGT